MSWGGFKKQLSRAGTTVMQKTGQVDKSDDSSFQAEVAKFKILEKNGNALQKEAKAYFDAMRAMTGAQARLGETVDHFYQDNSEEAMVAHSYKRAVEELDSRVTQTHEQTYRATVLEPIGKMSSHFPEVSATINKRGKKLLDYDAARSKARKSTDDPIKQARNDKDLEEAQAVFEAINEAVASELPQLIDLRIPYYDPSFEALVRMQTKFAEESYERIGGVQRYLPEHVREDYAQGRLDGQVETALQEIKELSICG